MDNHKNTHYAYLSGPNGMREPMMLFDLQGTGPTYRRRLLHDLLGQGLLLAVCPPCVDVETLEDLSNALQWLREDDPRR